MSLRSAAAPAVVTVAFAKCRFFVVAIVKSDPLPSLSIDALPVRRVMINACRSSGKNGRRALRILPWLSYSRNLTHAGLLMSCWSIGTLPTSGQRGAGIGEAGRLSGGFGSRLCAARSNFPAMLVGSPSGDATRVGEGQGVHRRDDPEGCPADWPPACGRVVKVLRLTSFMSSTTVWPGFIEITVNIA